MEVREGYEFRSRTPQGIVHILELGALDPFCERLRFHPRLPNEQPQRTTKADIPCIICMGRYRKRIGRERETAAKKEASAKSG